MGMSPYNSIGTLFRISELYYFNEVDTPILYCFIAYVIVAANVRAADFSCVQTELLKPWYTFCGQVEVKTCRILLCLCR